MMLHINLSVKVALVVGVALGGATRGGDSEGPHVLWREDQHYRSEWAGLLQ